MRRAIGAFNGMDDDGRQSAVLLHLQHAAEMLLKAALSEKKVKVFDSRSGRSIGFERCLALASEHLSMTADQAGTLRTIDALRDDEQHWLGQISEELLFLHVRATIEVLDNSLTGSDIQNGQIGQLDLADGTVNSAKTADNSLTGVDIEERLAILND